MAGGDGDLREACEKGDLSGVLRLLSGAGAPDVNATDEEGWSPLIMASKEGHIEVVRVLLGAGARPNPARVSHSALRGCSIFGHAEVVNVLLDAGADVDYPSTGGRTALMGAAMNGRMECAKILLARGAKAGHKNDGGETAKALARLKGHEDIAAAIEAAGG